MFLVGAPRSGTTWLQLLLSRSPHIATANETYLFTGYTRSLFAAWAHHQRNVRAVGLHNLISEEEYFDLIRNFTCKVMLRMLGKEPGGRYRIGEDSRSRSTLARYLENVSGGLLSAHHQGPTQRGFVALCRFPIRLGC